MVAKFKVFRKDINKYLSSDELIYMKGEFYENFEDLEDGIPLLIDSPFYEVYEYTGLNTDSLQPIYQNDTLLVNGQELKVKTGFHEVNSSFELDGVVLPEIYGHYLESDCGSWCLNLGYALKKYEVKMKEVSNEEIFLFLKNTFVFL